MDSKRPSLIDRWSSCMSPMGISDTNTYFAWIIESAKLDRRVMDNYASVPFCVIPVDKAGGSGNRSPTLNGGSLFTSVSTAIAD